MFDNALKTYLLFRIKSTNFSNQTRSNSKDNVINIIKLTARMENVTIFTDTQCPRSNKMRIAKRNKQNHIRNLGGIWALIFPLLQSFCSLRVIPLKCGEIWSILCTPPVIWKNVSYWPSHPEIKCNDLHMESKCLLFISELLINNSDAI